MTASPLKKTAFAAALLTLTLAGSALAPPPARAATATAAPASQPASGPASSAPDPDASPGDAADNEDAGTADDSPSRATHRGRHRFARHHGNDLVSVGHDVTLAAGAAADSVVAVFGSATSEGIVHQDVVAVFGDATVRGPVADSSVAVLGNVYVNSDIGQDVVSVLGNVTLGPAAHVHGDVVSVLGTVTADPAAVVDRGIQRILPEEFASASGIRRWLGHGLLFGRPLVIGSGLEWLWGIAFAFLAIYVILALLFGEATAHCIATLNANPGKSMVTAILAVLLTPLMLFLLAVTVVGIPAIPIALLALFCAAVFGKTAALGWLGNRCCAVRPGHAPPHPALAVLVGGGIAMLAYLVPVLGLVVFILLSMIGYGAVLYAGLNRVRHTTSGGSGPPPALPPAPATPAAGVAADTPLPEVAPLPLTTLPRAGFWVRIGALFIDVIVIGVLVRLLLAWPDHDHENRLLLLALAAYGAVMWKVRGTTVGGIVFDLRVVRLDSRLLDWPTVCVRALGCILSSFALFLGFIWIAVDPGRQAWHDKLAGTIVVRVPKGTPLV